MAAASPNMMNAYNTYKTVRSGFPMMRKREPIPKATRIATVTMKRYRVS
jgi:hypothetical protein